MFSNEFDSIKIKKIMQISRTLCINIQLFLLNQFNRSIFKLMIENSHLIVDTNLVFIFFSKRNASLLFASHFYLYTFFAFFLSNAAQLRLTYKINVFINSIIDRSQ